MPAFIVIPTSFIDLTACIAAQIGGLTFEKKAHLIQIKGYIGLCFEGGPIFRRLQSFFMMHHLTSLVVDLDEFLQKTAKKLEKIYGTARFDAINRAYADAVENMGIIAGTLKTTAEKFCHSEPLESETQRMCLHIYNTGVHQLQNDHQDLH